MHVPHVPELKNAILEKQLLVHGTCHNSSKNHVLNHSERLRHAF